SLSRAASATAAPAPATFAIEGWFMTSSNSGGKIIGYGNSQTGTSSTFDRHLYIDSGGRVTFGVGSQQTVRSTKAYNDGQWHYVVGQLSSAGLQLYVDGVRVAADAAVTSASSYTGYWRIGGDNLSGWPNRPANNFLNGRIDEVAIYPKALTAEQISLRYVASGRESTSKPPTAAFDWTADDLAASFDASGSTDQGGSIENYAWDFGDGETGTGRTVEHEYAAPGGYDVTLTVTDDEGMTGKVTKRVTVTGPGVIASDTFGRTTSSGWGSADVGGDWTGTGAAFSTASGVGRINFGSAGAMLGTGLTQPVGRDVTMITDLAVDKVLTGNGLAVSLQARRNGDSDYRLKVRFLPNGETHLVLARAVNGAETVLHEVNVPSVTYQAGQTLRVSFTVTGNGTTTLSGKIWVADGTEPASAQITRTDSTAALQSAGSVGLLGYLSGNVGNAPIRLTVDNLKVTSL
ncbi:MAG TPA: LamG-like jellyroll fold domain-containing protein, partial [Microlunatus sp.]|nr:LamG-like jellyroll fold domain-containing protein [Microlunatus sp.]